MAAIDTLAAIATVPIVVVAVLAGVLFVEVLAALAARRRGPPPRPGVRPRLAVVVPAHNEEAGIADTVTGIKGQLADGDRLVVVADNCSDLTDRVAANAGAEIATRHEPSRRGKGYAMEFGLKYLASSQPPAIVVFIDADCEPAVGALERIAAMSAATGRPVQARYDMLTPANASNRASLDVAAFAWRVKNHVRSLGLKAMGLPCQLHGSGMAFPWAVISQARLGTSQIVEDLALGIDLARAGKSALYCPDAIVSSAFPISAQGQTSQRERWETGHIGLIIGALPGSLRDAVLKRNWPLLVLAIDAAIPPLTLLTTLVCACLIVGATLWMSGASAIPFLISLASCLMLAVAVLLAWIFFARDVISLETLGRVPRYMLTKAAIYPQALMRRNLKWIRTRRD